MNYTPRDTTYLQILNEADSVCKKIGAKKMVDLRIARGGCFVTRYYMKTIMKNGLEIDILHEVKIYDNMKGD